MFARILLARQALRSSSRANVEAQKIGSTEVKTHDPLESVFPDVPHVLGHSVTTNSILQKFAPPIEFDERFLQRAKDALTESDKDRENFPFFRKFDFLKRILKMFFF